MMKATFKNVLSFNFGLNRRLWWLSAVAASGRIDDLNGKSIVID